ncbi:Benzoyl-CoA reductase/2-hydroxyglutaryl-CoA dehydratase subunit, BcrC/BadD/HgdB [Caminicella sporogenes DSM 14501]|uniref:Benzoyl-CoA reductase/2-hydroxyglutaryl-CoA dehydratase subunit, BcrC/BadD/HgdB n=1 Tax=Caminicella sporogenes DSM 14501 TaxID=1121266 RepID=A0A1M6R8Q5_9FIRM|nr:2-hydroxyacyl-CoA dehydratase [Caminicella sporogenes]RKD27343.1 2-hydroxyglutaryl-CoA dehydratase [Caminicella sporogenes]SHK28859.1 Benzoyl-CoA reductase/2-hydroxyglutaryl-CoA dehydratase subunit, BcrC/BadD/HgdB [Caminicella sporogenes DSM 14501]
MEKVGLTTTIPVEVLFAAGIKPIDLNNIFVVSKMGKEYIEKAEIDGFPRNLCSWIKGLYSVALENGINNVVGVVEGDCSNTGALLEVWKMKGINIYPFAFPQNRDIKILKREIDNLMKVFNVSLDEVDKIKRGLHKIRKRVEYLDELTWKYNKASGFENHLWHVSCSDFNGDYTKFSIDLEKKIKEIENRNPKIDEIRLGYIGVPPIFTDIYSIIEAFGGRVVYNEVQRAFSMTGFDIDDSVYHMYLNFSYPYGINFRLKDIKEQIKLRKLDGIIHYVQAFCYRGIEDIIVKHELDIPVLTIEGDLPGKVDARTRLRIESFIDMLKDNILL